MKNNKSAITPIISAASLGLLLAASSASAATTLFADNFNRANNTDLNASTDGKSGTLGNLDWLEKSSTITSPSIASNKLSIADYEGAAGWSIAYVDHNFIGATVATGFTLSVDITGSGSNGNTRLHGMFTGSSSTELANWSVNAPPFPVDFFFGYDDTGTEEVKIFTNGTQDFQSAQTLAADTTLSVNFTYANFNSGSTVNYEAFINGGSAKTGTFTWSGTEENFLGLYSNHKSGGTMDNFSVSVIPEPSAALLGGLGLLALLRRKR